ncbi:MAG: leucine-rich repeat domain-containing protein [Oscillospiraceae bacterium]|nr:leucine-rich repeat domain-containing protein [Oscillospiraceae bacterium]
MKKFISFIFCCLCFIFILSTPAFAIQTELLTENIPDDVKIRLTEVYKQSRNALTGEQSALMLYEPELIGTSNFGPEIMGGLFSDGSFVLTGIGSMTYRPSDTYDDFITSVYVDSGITSLYDECFKDCTALEYVYIMGTVTDLGDYTFAGCIALHTIVLEEGVSGMGQYTFSGCTGIQNLQLPSTLQLTITGFSGCTSLVTAGPKNGSYVVEFNRGSTIPDNAFIGMYYMQEITIPDGVTDIGSYAFGDCTSLSLVCIPESVKNISPVAFYNMQDISWVYYGGSQTQWNEINIADGNEKLKNAYFYYNTVPQVTVTTSYNHTPEISWEAVPFALGYEVFYALDSGTYYEYLTSASYPATSVTHTTAVEGETYHYVVRALMPENRYADFSKDVKFTVPETAHRYEDNMDKTCDICGYERIITISMYRLYNPNSGEHFYTGSTEERDTLINAGWHYEGVAWNAPVEGEIYIHRVYNPNSGDHHYSASKEEIDMLTSLGWRYEGIAWNSAEEGNVPQYRLYNPNADCGSHHYTSSTEEMNFLVSLGWIYEGIGWYGIL